MIDADVLRERIKEYDSSIILANTWIEDGKLTGILLLPTHVHDKYIQCTLKPLEQIPEKIDCLNRLMTMEDIDGYHKFANGFD